MTLDEAVQLSYRLTYKPDHRIGIRQVMGESSSFLLISLAIFDPNEPQERVRRATIEAEYLRSITQQDFLKALRKIIFDFEKEETTKHFKFDGREL